MKENCERDMEWFVGGPPHRGELVVVGGAPSMKNRSDVIQQRQKNGATLLALNGAHKFLKAVGVQPDMVLLCDSSPTVTGFIPDEPDNAIYLISSTCHPSVLDKLKGFDAVYLWHPEIPTEIERQSAILDKYPDRPCVLLGGGNTGAMRTFAVGYHLGYRAFHFYGIDSSYADDGSDHAYIKHDGTEPEPLNVKYGGKVYRCSGWMIRQADEFKFYYQQYAQAGCKIMVHGEGLIPDLWRAMREIERKHGKPAMIQKPETIH
jgi:hypothetical protein